MQVDQARRERGARTDHDAARTGVEPQHIKRLACRDLQAFPLPDREMDDALVLPEDAAGEVNDLARRRRSRPQPLDHVGIMAGRHEADVLAVLLVGDRETVLARQLAHARLRQAAERKAQHIELLVRGREQEITLIAVVIMRAIERAAAVGEARD